MKLRKLLDHAINVAGWIAIAAFLALVGLTIRSAYLVHGFDITPWIFY